MLPQIVVQCEKNSDLMTLEIVLCELGISLLACFFVLFFTDTEFLLKHLTISKIIIGELCNCDGELKKLVL